MAALRELAQAAGLERPNEFRAAHLVRRVPDNDVRLLSNVLPHVPPGLLLDEAAAGRAKWPRRVLRALLGRRPIHSSRRSGWMPLQAQSRSSESYTNRQPSSRERLRRVTLSD